MFEPLVPAHAIAADSAVPFSPVYGDVYHAAAGAFAQAEHVFIAGNGLPERWRGRADFTVLETGFGLGLNFLALWRAWRADPARSERLHVVSVEAHPFTRDELASWLRDLVPGELRVQADALLAAWPPLLPGLHSLSFEQGRMRLTLAFGKAAAIVPRLSLAADAYFLDGFAPARNPEMWSDALIAALAEHAAPGATAATWASAGQVRRALAAVGFAVRKRPGFAGKRDMTVAEHPVGGACGRRVLAQRRTPGRALVVGAGVAGAGVAHALAARGWAVDVVAPDDAAHAGHAAAALTPTIDPGDSVRARLARAGAGLAHGTWRPVIAPTLADAGETAVAWRLGTVQVAPRRQLRSDEAYARWREGLSALGFPADWLRLIDAADAAELAGQPVGRGGAWLPAGLLVRPGRLQRWLLEAPGVRRVRARVARLAAGDAGWTAYDEAGRACAGGEVLVLACAGGTADLARASDIAWPLGDALQAVAGQITYLPEDLVAGLPRCVVAGDGYVLPALDGRGVAGSTYDHATQPGMPAPASAEGHARNLEHLRALLPQAAWPAHADWRGWAGWRAVLPGRLPAIGALPGAAGVFVATAYASRGLSHCALAGALIASHLSGTPAPIEADLQAAIGPGRAAGA
ncbi:tRNA (5-methylaminomethyl-2-thiouridine)(34)-methyltransferase MnmD [Verticiella sediminum]|nr:tRNA (5-methylaminomethyl-2-thiouridine)(34)-methyltransferase MnmD [Verticiella sediminum]